MAFLVVDVILVLYWRVKKKFGYIEFGQTMKFNYRQHSRRPRRRRRPRQTSWAASIFVALGGRRRRMSRVVGRSAVCLSEVPRVCLHKWRRHTCLVVLYRRPSGWSLNSKNLKRQQQQQQQEASYLWSNQLIDQFFSFQGYYVIVLFGFGVISKLRRNQREPIGSRNQTSSIKVTVFDLISFDCKSFDWVWNVEQLEQKNCPLLWLFHLAAH